MLADEPDLQLARFFHQAGGNRAGAGRSLLRREKNGMAAVAVVGVPKMDGDDAHVFGAEIEAPFFVEGDAAAGQAEVEVAYGELAALAGCAIGVDDVGGVVAAEGFCPV